MNFKSKTMRHLQTVVKHRHYVNYFCRKAGIPWQGLTHDLSKFNPIEFCEGVKYYSGIMSPIDKCKQKQGYSDAWFHHRGRNKHHWEYWVDSLSKDGIPVEMPYRYAVEMLCDWAGAGLAYTKFTNMKDAARNEIGWWNQKKDHMKLAPNTRKFVETVFSLLKEYDYDYNLIFNEGVLKLVYAYATQMQTEEA